MSFKTLSWESCSAAGSFANEAWQPMLFVSLQLDSSLLNDRIGSSEKSPTTGTHTHICLVQWKAEDFFCGLCLHNQQTTGSGSCCSPCAVLDGLGEKKGKECQGRLQVLTCANLLPWVSQQFQHHWHRKLYKLLTKVCFGWPFSFSNPKQPS